MYQQLLDNPHFKPCDPIGCGIGSNQSPKPICGVDGDCRPCMRDGECVMSYRVYLDEFYPHAKCNSHSGKCTKE